MSCARKIGAAQQRLVREIHVAGVEDRPPAMTDRRADRAEDMPRIVEIKGERLVLRIGITVAATTGGCSPHACQTFTN